MKTRRILAASTAALLAFGSVAIVASAAEDFADVTTEKDDWTDISKGVQARVTEKAQKANADYALGGDGAATAAAFSTIAQIEDTSKSTVTAAASLDDTFAEKLSSSMLKKVLKAVPTNKKDDGTYEIKSASGADIQVFDITATYNSEKEEIPMDAIKLPADVTIRLTSDVKGDVYHLSSDGKTLEAVKASKTQNADKTEFYYVFTTNQFSSYVVTNMSISGLSSVGTAATTSDASDASAATSDGETSTNPETGIALAIAPVVLAAGAVAVVALKKKH